MKKEIIVSEKLSKPLGIFSQALKAEGKRLLFISGMTARDKEGNIDGEARSHWSELFKCRAKEVIANQAFESTWLRNPLTSKCIRIEPTSCPSPVSGRVQEK